MDKKIFSGLENMGFDNIEDIKIYNKETETVKEEKGREQGKVSLYIVKKLPVQCVAMYSKLPQ